MVLQLPFYSIHSLNSNNQFMGNITSFANCCCAACVDLDVLVYGKSIQHVQNTCISTVLLFETQQPALINHI